MVRLIIPETSTIGFSIFDKYMNSPSSLYRSIWTHCGPVNWQLQRNHSISSLPFGTRGEGCLSRVFAVIDRSKNSAIPLWKKTHILKLLVTKANPFYASEETVLATNPIDVLEKEKKWFHMSGNTTFLISLENSLCLFFFKHRQFSWVFQGPIDC